MSLYRHGDDDLNGVLKTFEEIKWGELICMIFLLSFICHSIKAHKVHNFLHVPSMLRKQLHLMLQSHFQTSLVLENIIKNACLTMFSFC